MDIKGWLQSKTLIGIALAAVAFVLSRFFGIDVPEEEVNTLRESYQPTMEWVLALGGTILAVIGRLTAKTKIGAAPLKKAG